MRGEWEAVVEAQSAHAEPQADEPRRPTAAEGQDEEPAEQRREHKGAAEVRERRGQRAPLPRQRAHRREEDAQREVCPEEGGLPRGGRSAQRREGGCQPGGTGGVRGDGCVKGARKGLEATGVEREESVSEA